MIYFLFGIFVLILIVRAIAQSTKDADATNPLYIKKTSSHREVDRLTEKYKKLGLKDFPIRGSQYLGLSDSADSGGFIGYLIPTVNEHDTYAIGVFRKDDNTLLGYTPKGNFRLKNTINQYSEGSLLCWGHLHFDDYNSRWSGWVNTVLGMSKSEEKKMLELFELQRDINRKTKLSNDLQTKIEGAHALKNFNDNYFDLAMKAQIGLDVDNRFFANLVKALEEQSMWSEIINLTMMFPKITDLVPERSKPVTEKRIANAQNKLRGL